MREVGYYAKCTRWLAIAYEVRNRILLLNGEILIPELNP